MSHRKAQLESTMKRAIATVLARELQDPRVQGMVSVTQVDLTDDLHDATVYVSILPESKQLTSLRGLQAATRYIQGLLLKAMSIKSVPRLHFRLDESLKKQARIFEAIQRGLEQDRSRRASESQESDAPNADEKPAEDVGP